MNHTPETRSSCQIFFLQTNAFQKKKIDDVLRDVYEQIWDNYGLYLRPNEVNVSDFTVF